MLNWEWVGMGTPMIQREREQVIPAHLYCRSQVVTGRHIKASPNALQRRGQAGGKIAVRCRISMQIITTYVNRGVQSVQLVHRSAAGINTARSQPSGFGRDGFGLK